MFAIPKLDLSDKKTKLIAILIVAAVIIMIISFVASLFGGGSVTKNYDIDKNTRLTAVQLALENYYADNGNYPENLDLLTRATDQNPGYLVSIPKDPELGTNFKYTPSPEFGPYTSYILTTPLTKNAKGQSTGLITKKNLN